MAFCLYLYINTRIDEQQMQNNSMEQEVETNREASAANVSVEAHADDSDDSL